MVNQIYPPELQLNKVNYTDTEASFLLQMDLFFLQFMIVAETLILIAHLAGDFPRRAYYEVCISQLIGFAGVCNHVADFNARNKCLTAKILQQGIGIINFEIHFLNFIADTMN